MNLAVRFLLHLGCVKQGGDNRCGADSDRHAGLDQLGTSLLACPVDFVAFVVHARSSMAFAAGWEAG